jgi:hypothetical protein
MNTKILTITEESEKANELVIFANSNNRIFIRIGNPDEVNYCEQQCIVLDKEDAIALRNEISKLLREYEII